jgi:hypothetical protein
MTAYGTNKTTPSNTKGGSQDITFRTLFLFSDYTSTSKTTLVLLKVANGIAQMSSDFHSITTPNA